MASNVHTINLVKAIAGVEIEGCGEQTAASQERTANGRQPENTSPESGNNEQKESLDTQVKNVEQLCQALQSGVENLKKLQQNIIKEHKKQIAKFSLEIARKVLMQKIDKGDYKIESIIEQALDNAPDSEDATVHLNPEDLELLQKTQEENNINSKEMTFVADKNIGKAQCIIETPKGTVESVIEDHLEKISKALEKVE